MMRQGPEVTISRLRAALEEASQRDATAKAALAKSDAVILELRSSIRQLKRQVEQIQKDKEDSDRNVELQKRELQEFRQKAISSLNREKELHDEQVSKLQSQLHVSETHAKDQKIGELQVQLDRAHAQILTADMVRKELEDTLEAEQYTWELRVQDQERQIALLQQECNTLKDDLEQCRAQWREAEEGWKKEIKGLQSQAKDRDGDVYAKLRTLEKEREELQGCLDEAMKELEAVDEELRQNPDIIEPLQHLYQWLLERTNKVEEDVPSDVATLVKRIKKLFEHSPNSSVKVAELEAQLSVYRGDLKAREESSAELRASLKEAVGLLKPLQDAVAKTDKEKKELEQRLASLAQERDELLAKAKSPVLSPHSMLSITSPRTMPSGEEQQEQGGARSKRNSAQKALQSMLSSAQHRFESLQKDNSHIIEENEMLQRRIEELEHQLVDLRSVEDEESIKRDVASEMREAAIQQLEEDVSGYTKELMRKDKELEQLRQELQHARDTSSEVPSDYETIKSHAEELEREVLQKREIESRLASVKRELLIKTEAEQMLNDSLKEALSLLKPLQTHLETAEHEKKTLEKQLKKSKKKLVKLEQHLDGKSPRSRDLPEDQTSELSVVVHQLEEENARLRPQQNKLQEELVEVKSKYEVTQDRLESASVENHALVEALRQKEHAEKEMMEELEILRRKLEKSNHELENAKYIATSALMKVEELTMANLSSSMTREVIESKENGNSAQHHSDVHRMKLKLESLEKEMANVRELNDSLEESIQERDRMLQALAKQTGSPPRGNGARRGVSWNN
jgi:CAP-Gly domain-containing linker protein 1